jgi:RNA polymerase sigma factor (sigma-70 family)
MGTGRDERAGTDVQNLFRLHYLGLVRLAMRLVDDQESAEDLVQDVFAGLARRPVALDDPIRYLRGAVVNRSRSVLRRRYVTRASWATRRPRAEAGAPADEPTMQHVERQQMLAAIARLPRRQREAVVLRYYEDLPVRQIAGTLETTPGAVSSALNRALAALASIVEHRHGD